MSKGKPEVGDVYESGYGKKILVVQVWEERCADCIVQAWRGVPFYLEIRHIPLGDFEFLTYIGKNITESKDLFKTEG